VSVFVDTNVFVAAADSGELRSTRARELLRRHAAARLVTSDHVLVETWAIIRRRTDYQTAERFLSGFRRSRVALEAVTAADIERASAIGELWRDQRFDLVDRTSMAVMERIACDTIASFDRDFAVYRFGPERRRALTVLT
jgi:uncharacterized protein